MATTTNENIHKAVHEAVEQAVKDLQEIAIKKALESYERQLRAHIAETAMNISNFYNIERNQGEVVIKVRIGDTPKGGG